MLHLRQSRQELLLRSCECSTYVICSVRVCKGIVIPLRVILGESSYAILVPGLSHSVSAKVSGMFTYYVPAHDPHRKWGSGGIDANGAMWHVTASIVNRIVELATCIQSGEHTLLVLGGSVVTGFPIPTHPAGKPLSRPEFPHSQTSPRSKFPTRRIAPVCLASDMFWETYC